MSWQYKTLDLPYYMVLEDSWAILEQISTKNIQKKKRLQITDMYKLLWAQLSFGYFQMFESLMQIIWLNTVLIDKVKMSKLYLFQFGLKFVFVLRLSSIW